METEMAKKKMAPNEMVVAVRERWMAGGVTPRQIFGELFSGAWKEHSPESASTIKRWLSGLDRRSAGGPIAGNGIDAPRADETVEEFLLRIETHEDEQALPFDDASQLDRVEAKLDWLIAEWKGGENG